MTEEAIQEAEAAAGQALSFVRGATGWTLREKVLLGIIAAGLLLAAGVWAFHKPAPVPEVVQARPEVHQADGSVIAATVPGDSAAARALPTPTAAAPRGGVLQRTERTVLQPRPTAASACPPVTVDLQQYQQGDTVRVVASSPDATVLSSVDVVMRPQLLPPPDRPWAGGLSYGTDRAVGVWVEHDLGRLRAGLEVERSAVATTARVRLGVRW